MSSSIQAGAVAACAPSWSCVSRALRCSGQAHMQSCKLSAAWATIPLWHTPSDRPGDPHLMSAAAELLNAACLRIDHGQLQSGACIGETVRSRGDVSACKSVGTQSGRCLRTSGPSGLMLRGCR